jgi:hypothetical protein
MAKIILAAMLLYITLNKKGSPGFSGKYPRFGVCVRASPAHTPQIWGIIPLKPGELQKDIRKVSMIVSNIASRHRWTTAIYGF